MECCCHPSVTGGGRADILLLCPVHEWLFRAVDELQFCTLFNCGELLCCFIVHLICAMFATSHTHTRQNKYDVTVKLPSC